MFPKTTHNVSYSFLLFIVVGIIISVSKVEARYIAKPSFIPFSNEIVGPAKLTITTYTPHVLIYYSLDGSTPSETSFSSLLVEDGLIFLNNSGAYHLNAVAIDNSTMTRIPSHAPTVEPSHIPTSPTGTELSMNISDSGSETNSNADTNTPGQVASRDRSTIASKKFVVLGRCSGPPSIRTVAPGAALSADIATEDSIHFIHKLTVELDCPPPDIHTTAGAGAAVITRLLRYSVTDRYGGQEHTTNCNVSCEELALRQQRFQHPVIVLDPEAPVSSNSEGGSGGDNAGTTLFHNASASGGVNNSAESAVDFVMDSTELHAVLVTAYVECYISTDSDSGTNGGSVALFDEHMDYFAYFQSKFGNTSTPFDPNAEASLIGGSPGVDGSAFQIMPSIAVERQYYLALAEQDSDPVCITCSSERSRKFRAKTGTDTDAGIDSKGSDDVSGDMDDNSTALTLSVEPDMLIHAVQKTFTIGSGFGKRSRTVRGRLMVLYNPLGHFDFLPPLHGCKLEPVEPDERKNSSGINSTAVDDNSNSNGNSSNTSTTAPPKRSVATLPSITGRHYIPRYSTSSSLHALLFEPVNDTGAPRASASSQEVSTMYDQVLDKWDGVYRQAGTGRIPHFSDDPSSLAGHDGNSVSDRSGNKHSDSRGGIGRGRSGLMHPGHTPRGCYGLTNAGFFNVTSGECFGNLVTGNRIVQTSSHHSVSFGVRNGRYVVGYLHEEDIYSEDISAGEKNEEEEEEEEGTDSDFDTLITGLGWLVRNSRPYIHDSLFNYNTHATSIDLGKNPDSSSGGSNTNTSTQTQEEVEIEDLSKFQGTGRADTFANVLSARTAIGYDDQGRLLLLQMEGKTWDNGVSLYEFADFAVELGFKQAINLDGGGSATMTVNNALLTEPQWQCVAPAGDAEELYLYPSDSGIFANRGCEKEVASVTCIHAMAPPQLLRTSQVAEGLRSMRGFEGVNLGDDVYEFDSNDGKSTYYRLVADLPRAFAEYFGPLVDNGSSDNSDDQNNVSGKCNNEELIYYQQQSRVLMAITGVLLLILLLQTLCTTQRDGQSSCARMIRWIVEFLDYKPLPKTPVSGLRSTQAAEMAYLKLGTVDETFEEFNSSINHDNGVKNSNRKQINLRSNTDTDNIPIDTDI